MKRPQSLATKLKSVDSEIKNYVTELEAINLKLQKEIAKLQAQNVSDQNEITALKKAIFIDLNGLWTYKKWYVERNSASRETSSSHCPDSSALGSQKNEGLAV